MTDKENLKPDPAKDNQDKPESVALESKDSATPSVFALPEKFKGKSAEEIAKSYVELERAFTEKSSKKVEEPVKEEDSTQETIDDIIKLFMPEPEPTPKKAPEQPDQRAYVAQQLRQKFELEILKARTDKSMPQWGDVEAEVLEFAKAKPGLLTSGSWAKDCYEIISAKKEAQTLKQKLEENEKRGKEVAMTEDKKAEATVVGGGEEIKAPETPKPAEKTKAERMAEINALPRFERTRAWQKLVEDTLTDAEKAA